MMTDRRKIDFGDDDDLATPPPPPVPIEQIRTVTRQAGFHETPKAAKSGPVSEPPEQLPALPRRARRKTGRTHQFATRLRIETVRGFQEYADTHEITIAETLERALKALLDSESSKNQLGNS